MRTIIRKAKYRIMMFKDGVMTSDDTVDSWLSIDQMEAHTRSMAEQVTEEGGPIVDKVIIEEV